MGDIPVPDGWTEIETQFEEQLSAFQRSSDGLVVSIEQGTTSLRYAVTFLPDEFHEVHHVEPIPEYGDSGYLYTGDSLASAQRKAKEWMENNPE